MNTLSTYQTRLWVPPPTFWEGTQLFKEELDDMASPLEKFRAQQLLKAIRAAGDSSKADELKAQLFNSHLAAILQGIIRKKLQGNYPYEPDSVAERVWDIASTQVLTYLNRQALGEKAEPESICDYVATLTFHAISYVLGESDKSYRTFRLNTIDLIRRNEKFIALWRNVRRQWCSEVSYRTVTTMSNRWNQLQNNPDSVWKVQGHTPSDPQIVIVLALLRYLAHPVPVEPFVRLLAEAKGMTSTKAISLSGTTTEEGGDETVEVDLPSVADDPARIAERRRQIDVVLQAVEKLDGRRRIILLLNILPELCDLHLLVGDLRERVQSLLEIDASDFERFWTQEKCSDQEIATLLKITPSNVGFLRNDARAKLQQHMKSLWE